MQPCWRRNAEARTRTLRPLRRRNAFVHTCPFLAPMRVRSFPAGAHCGTPHVRACAGRHPARFERAAGDWALRGTAQALYTGPHGYSDRTFYSARYVRKRGWHVLDPMTHGPSLNRHLCRRHAIPRAAGTRRACRRRQQPGWSRSGLAAFPLACSRVCAARASSATRLSLKLRYVRITKLGLGFRV